MFGRSRRLAGAVPVLAALALAGCAMLGSPPSSDGRPALWHLAIQPDLAHRSHRKASRRPASLQHARFGLRRDRTHRTGARRFQQSDQPRSQLRAGLRQSRLCFIARPTSSSSRLPTTTRRCRSMAATRPPISAAASSTASRAAARRRSRTSTRRSRSSRTMPRPITIAACSIKSSISTNSPSTTSPPPSGSPRRRPNRALPAH